jgi:transposase
MERYIGLDVHAASCTVAVVSERGKRLRDFPVETSGQALIEAISAIPGHRHLVMEEGTQSAWLYETLERHVEEIVVASVADSRGPKSDARDAYGLAEKLRIGAIPKRVFKAPAQFRRLREIARVHEMLVRDVVRVQARLKSIYRSRGVTTPGGTVYGVKNRQEWLAKLPPASAYAASKLYEHYDALTAIRDQTTAELLAEAQQCSIARILQTAPGLGPIRVARLMPIVVTPHRFRTKRQFWSYCGFGIVMRSSSDWARTTDGGWARGQVQRTRGLSRNHNHTLKAIFKGAATTVITQDKDGPAYNDYRRLLDAGTKPNLAKLTLARKIAAAVLRMWKDEEVYRPNREMKETSESNSPVQAVE